MHYWRLPSVSSARPTLFCEVAALLDRNCIFRLSAVSLTMFEGWSPPDPMTSDSEVICEAWASSVCPQALDIASYKLPLSVDEAPGRFIDAERSEERRVGKECVSTCRSRWCRYNKT